MADCMRFHRESNTQKHGLSIAHLREGQKGDGMKTIALEEHFLTPEALRVTESVRDAGLALVYHDENLKARLLDIGAGRIADMDANGIGYQVLSLAVCGVELLEASQAVA